jgi:catechol 1,2-dioxygenase
VVSDHQFAAEPRATGVSLMAGGSGDGARLVPLDATKVELDESRINPRLIAVVDALAKAIEGVIAEQRITHEEYQLFRQMMIEQGSFAVGTFDPFISPMLERVHHTDRIGTSANPEGPFYVAGAPMLEPPYSLVKRGEAGDPLIVSGQVRGEDGSPLAGAELDLWQCNVDGYYSNLGMSTTVEDWDFRGRLLTDSDGRFEFRTIKPPPYRPDPAMVPQLVEDLFLGLGRSMFRPAHIHIAILHPALPEGGRYLSQIYFAGDPYRDYDIGAAVRDDLISSPVLHDDPAEIREAGYDRPFSTIDFDFVVVTKEPAAAS